MYVCVAYCVYTYAGTALGERDQLFSAKANLGVLHISSCIYFFRTARLISTKYNAFYILPALMALDITSIKRNRGNALNSLSLRKKLRLIQRLLRHRVV